MKKLVLVAALAACAPTTSELRGPVDDLVATRMGAPREKVNVHGLLAKPLDRSAAQKIAIANNARLAAAFDELGIAGGELGAALGLGPVRIEAMLRFSPDEYEVNAVQSVMGLLSAPRRRASAHAEIDAAKARAAAETLKLVARVDIAFTDLLAAEQALDSRREAFAAADASATLRERMYAAGNTTALAQARERAEREQARITLGRAEATVELRRAALDALLGLSGDDTKWTATGSLAAVPDAAPSLDGLEASAVSASLAIEAGRYTRDAAENRAADLRLRTVLPDLGVGVSVHDDEAGTGVGPMIALGIPLFDWKSGERAKANAQIDRAAHELTATAVDLRADARSARTRALAAYQEARHYELIVLPLRQQILDETLKHYNAMDAEVFELLIARRDLVDAEDQALDARRRYWNAMAAVDALNRGVSIMLTDEVSPARATAPQPEEHR
ncbi:MAG TPA: TolC family protein [Kofleriaceae bacterium]|jgi:outer membrane protein TolC